jgi:hypothetical protein
MPSVGDWQLTLMAASTGGDALVVAVVDKVVGLPSFVEYTRTSEVALPCSTDPVEPVLLLSSSVMVLRRCIVLPGAYRYHSAETLAVTDGKMTRPLVALLAFCMECC